MHDALSLSSAARPTSVAPSLAATGSTRPRTLIESLEGLRGVAALAVALYHLHLAQKGWLDHGYLMVDLFFVLSGFIMFLTYSERLNRPDELRGFLIRRAGRLLPLYFVTTLVTFVALDAIGAGWNVANHAIDIGRNVYVPDLSDVFANLTLTHFLTVMQSRVINWPSWSIGTEFYAYLVFALTCLLVPTRHRLLAILTLATASAIAFAAMRVGVDGCLSTGKCLDAYQDAGFFRCTGGFFLGGLLFMGWRKLGSIDPERRATRRLTAWQWPASIVVLATIVLVPTHAAVAFLVPLVFAALIFTLLPDAGPVARWLKVAPVQALGRWSYSIYLVHATLAVTVEFVIDGLGVDSPAERLGVVAVYVVVLLTASRWTYRHVEIPARDWFNGWARRTSPACRQAAVTSGVAVNR